MRIPSHYINSVVFIGWKSSDAYHIGGTGFFVGYPVEGHPTGMTIYVVTARHNVRFAADRGIVCIRRNTQRGDAIWTEAHSGWMYPDDEASDVAVFDLPTDPTVVPPTVVPVKLFATDEVFQAHGFGLGDKVVAIGLFKKREGRSQNLPIVRSGILSGMPDEPLEDPRSGLPYSAYLIEIRSIGGLSGSPVVIGIEGPAELPSGEIVGVSRARFRLLGLIRGHWDVTSYQGADFFDREVESFNSGIALVTPCTEILPILEREDVVRERRRHNRKSSYARTR